MSDTGAIGRAKIVNGSDKNVFIRGGSLLKGATQSRVVEVGVVVAPQKEQDLEIRCVHRSGGISAGATFDHMGIATPRVQRSLYRRAGGQGATWNAVSRDSYAMYSMSAGAVSEELVGRDDLVGTLERVNRFKDDIEEALKKVPGDHVDQVGIAIIDSNGVNGVEIFDHPDSWKAFSKNVIRNNAEILSKESSDLFELKMASVEPAVLDFMEKLSKAKEVDTRVTNVSKTVVLDGEAVSGEYTTMGDSTIHVLGTRKEEDQKPQRPTSGLDDRAILGGIYRRPLTQTTETSTFVADDLASENVDYQMITQSVFDNFFHRRGSYDMLNVLMAQPQTYKDLHNQVNVSNQTLTNRLHEAGQMGLIDQKPRTNGRLTYGLTDNGRKALKQAKNTIRS